MSSIDSRELEKRIDSLSSTAQGAQLPDDARTVVRKLLDALETGQVRAATKDEASGEWRAVPWVKRGILLGFRVGGIVDMSIGEGEADVVFSFFDKDTYPPRRLTRADGIRVVPGGSSIRRGAYLASGVVCMPPMYINVGAHVGAGTMIDSHALVGSCAQVGERVHLSASAQLGGVLEPVNAAPVVVEDDVVIGGNCGIYEGTVVRKRAVIGAGVILTRGTPVYDLERQTVHRASSGSPLVIPENAVVVPGARSIKEGWGQSQGLSLQTPVIVKYRDEKTDAATALESWLR
ncbi:MAG TPA: 2,3,4,5-tetrahydropyridine-2,6-dicarboxylate N-succinyltransferase [Gemmatimonadaceae bacterium]|nr:2,3,4,5-tetrahydropyridine-2,6-dicarboxylate N-succinyltransferase [Gemmatimonadaceae bacterium]